MRSPGPARDDRAAMPVIGIILMVLVTMLLASVVGSFALGLASFVDTGAPAADLQFDHDGAEPGTLTIVHEHGEAIPETQVEFDIDGETRTTADCAGGRWAEDGVSVTAGDTCRLEVVPADATVKVVWYDRNSSGIVAVWSA